MPKFQLSQVCLCVVLWSLSVTSEFNVYWNVPSYLCSKFGIHINVSEFGIVQNTNDRFYGDKVNIFYKHGLFPTLNGDGSVRANGGIPQKGNLTAHISTFTQRVKAQLPHNYTGVAVLDFESYYPSFDMSPPEYRDASRSWVSSLHPKWPGWKVEDEARRTFNNSAQEFFQVLLKVGRELCPGALWGYYHYPYCHNYKPSITHCKPQVQDHNDASLWLIQDSGALYPSIYVFENSGWSPRARRLQARVRLGEAIRMTYDAHTPNTPILPYFWYRYHDSLERLSSLDLVNTMGLVRMMGLDGAVVWGSSSDVASHDQCLQFKSYAEDKLGPLVRYLQELPLSSLPRLLRSHQRLRSFVTSALTTSPSHTGKDK